jgi:hypothetical protein
MENIKFDQEQFNREIPEAEKVIINNIEDYKKEIAQKTPENDGNKESAEKKGYIKIGTILRAAFLGGLMGVLEACGGLTPQQMQMVPLTQVEQLTNNPNQYYKEIVKTEGYLKADGKKVIRVPITTLQTIGDMSYYRTDWVSSQRDYYKLYKTTDTTGTSIDVVVLSDVNFSYFIPLDLKGSNLGDNQKYQVVGTFEKVRDDNNNESYVIRAMEVPSDGNVKKV